MEKTFAFEFGDRVKLVESDEKGTVIGRAEYPNRPNNYFLRYKNVKGAQATSWWDEEHIEKAE